MLRKVAFLNGGGGGVKTGKEAGENVGVFA